MKPPIRPLRVLDTTLRDGDQSAYGSFTTAQKLALARALDEAGVDCIEAGFPASSRTDRESCRLIANEGLRAEIAVMSRARPDDIKLSAETLGGSAKGVLHLSLPVSDLHIRTKLRKTGGEILALARESARFAAELTPLVEMGAEDATRADRSFLAEYCDAVTESGARIVNIADTVGIGMPSEITSLVRYLLSRVPAFRDGRALLSVHCHNDLGLACANTLAAIAAGCGQIEVTALGVGERAGNAALEEVLAALVSRSDRYPARVNLIPSEIGNVARLLSSILGTDLSPFKPITGRNVRAHASGIHQQGTILNPGTYAAVAIERFGTERERIVPGRHAGRSGLTRFMRECAGIAISDEMAGRILAELKDARDDAEYGATEILIRLAKEGLVSAPVIRRGRLSLTECDSADGSETWYRAKADFNAHEISCPKGSLTTRSLGPFNAESRDWTDAFLAIANQITPARVVLDAISFSGYRAESGRIAKGIESPKARVFVKVSVSLGAPEEIDRREYAIERIGDCLAELFVDCLLDALNQYHAPSGQS